MNLAVTICATSPHSERQREPLAVVARKACRSCTRLLLQFLFPVEDDCNGQGCAIATNNGDKALPIWTRIENGEKARLNWTDIEDADSLQIEQRDRLSHSDRLSGYNRHCHQLAIARKIEQFFTVMSPLRFGTAGC